MISSINSTTSTANGSSGAAATSTQGMQDQFLTLLVAQLQNQDPTNPMDNAQMTSQMAQISTVTGIEKLNDTVSGVTSQFNTMQILQGTSLIGRTVLSEGNTMTTNKEGQSTAAFDLDGTAANVNVTISTKAGEVLGTVDMGSLNKGRHYFNWDSTQYSGDASNLRFSVQAKNGEATIPTTSLAANAVIATNIGDGKLMLEMADGTMLENSKVKAVF